MRVKTVDIKQKISHQTEKEFSIGNIELTFREILSFSDRRLPPQSFDGRSPTIGGR